MRTQCNQESFQFHPLNQRPVVGRFDGGAITSEAGGLLLREVEKRTGIVKRFAACFRDHRKPEQVEHTVRELVAQRVYALALGYEDRNDHEQLRPDPLLAILAEKADPTGETRVSARDRGKALAGKSTLKRLELTKAEVAAQERDKKLVMDQAAVDRLRVEIFLEAHASPPMEITLDLDATHDPVPGNPEGRFFHGSYGHYCYMPLDIFCGDALLCARLRPSNIDAAAGCVEELARIVAQIRQAWPHVKITQRGDSGFCREELMAWCEAQGVDYLLGLAKNPRFVVTSLSPAAWEARALYEKLYCARGEMENRRKEQLMLFADRTSTAFLRSNQNRLHFSSVAYVRMEALRRLGLTATDLAQAQVQTIRLQLLKVGALIRITARRVCVALADGYPYAELCARVLTQLQVLPLRC